MVTGVEIGIIVTANYTFLNYLVLALGFLLLDDRFLVRFLPKGWATAVRKNLERPAEAAPKGDENGGRAKLSWGARRGGFARAGTVLNRAHLQGSGFFPNPPLPVPTLPPAVSPPS